MLTMPKETPTFTPEEIRAMRKTLGMNQTDFGAVIGVGYQAVSDWERGVKDPSPMARRMLWIVSEQTRDRND